MIHVFGPIPPEGLASRDRLCNEPIMPKGTVDRTYHVEVEVSAKNDGDFVCKKCGESFLHAKD